MSPHTNSAPNKENTTPLGTVTPAKKSSKPKAKSTKPKAPPKQAKWSAADDANLIQVLTDQQAAGNQADNAWKGSVWQAASRELAGSETISGGAVKTPSKCRTRWDKVSISIRGHFHQYWVLICPQAQGRVHRYQTPSRTIGMVLG